MYNRFTVCVFLVGCWIFLFFVHLIFFSANFPCNIHFHLHATFVLILQFDYTYVTGAIHTNTTHFYYLCVRKYVCLYVPFPE